MAGWEQRIATQVAQRPFEGPFSTGAVEGVLRHVADVLDRRAQVMTNRVRCEKLLQLIQLHLMGLADEVARAEKIRAHLLRRQGWAHGQRPHDDPLGNYSLLALERSPDHLISRATGSVEPESSSPSSRLGTVLSIVNRAAR